MYIDADKLRAKGWTEAEITHAKRIVSHAKRRKHPHRAALNEAIFWGMLFLAMSTVAAVAYWVIPLFMFAKSSALYPTITLIGLSFGALFSHAIKDLEHLEPHHHLLLATLIPVTGILSFLALLGSISNVEAYGGIEHSPIIVGGAFVASLFAPHLFYLLLKK